MIYKTKYYIIKLVYKANKNIFLYKILQLKKYYAGYKLKYYLFNYNLSLYKLIYIHILMYKVYI